jgi:CheY-like chemotaxis protein
MPKELNMNRINDYKNRRVLVIDDNRAIHGDFRKILAPEGNDRGFDDLAEELLGESAGAPRGDGFEVTSAYQGQEGLEFVKQSLAASAPFAMAFVDVRMPPGWDGIETVARMWELYPDLQVVICTAYSDYSWDQMIERLGRSDRLLILKKPFDVAEVLQLANALTEKWCLTQKARARMEDLEEMVSARTKDLEAANAELKMSNQHLINLQSHVKQLAGLLPICCLCKKVRDDQNYWHQVEAYIAKRTDAKFTHSYCPDCFKKMMGEIQAYAANSPALAA